MQKSEAFYLHLFWVNNYIEMNGLMSKTTERKSVLCGNMLPDWLLRLQVQRQNTPTVLGLVNPTASRQAAAASQVCGF